MKIADNVKSCFDDAADGKFDAALLHACIAIDATSKLLYPKQKAVGKRYTQCIRDYYWLVEPMLGAGINLEETVFRNVKLPKTDAPDFAEIVYEVFRCGHVHGDEVPESFAVLPSKGHWNSNWMVGKNTLRFPDRVVWALLSISIFARVNERQKVWSIGAYVLSLGDTEFPVEHWWGREDDVRPIAREHNQVRVKMEELQRMLDAPDDGAVGQILIVQPNIPDHIRLRAEQELGRRLPVEPSDQPSRPRGAGGEPP